MFLKEVSYDNQGFIFYLNIF